MVWSAWWFIGSVLESRWVGLQLYLSSIWFCYSAYSLCKVFFFFFFKFFSFNLFNSKGIIRNGLCNLCLNYLILFFCSNIYYVDDHLDKRTWTYIFGACCATTVFIPSFHNYRIWSFLGLGMTTYTAWYLTVAALANGQVIRLD